MSKGAAFFAGLLVGTLVELAAEWATGQLGIRYDLTHPA